MTGENATSIQELQDKVVWRKCRDSENCIVYLCIKCKAVIYTVDALRRTTSYKKKLIEVVNTHLLSCLDNKEVVEVRLPNIRMIRI